MPRLSLDDLIHKEPRRAVRWVQDHLSDVPRMAEHGGRDAVEWVQAHLPSRRELRSRGKSASRRAERGGSEAVEWVQAHLPSSRDLRGRTTDAGALLWPTVIAAAGAGAAFWWWTSWSRGRAEAERSAIDAEGGAQGKAHPESVMAHAPPAGDAGPPPPDPRPGQDAAAPGVMAHAARTGEPGPKLKAKPVIAPKAQAALRRNLAVQASEGEPKPNGSKPAPLGEVEP